VLSDFWPHGKVGEMYGVLRTEGYTERAIFIIDPDGIIRYIDIHDIDDQPNNDVLFAEIEKIATKNNQRVVMSKPVEEELPHGGVVMYCTTWCPDCRRARTWFAQHNIPFREVDITRNRAAAAQVRQWARGFETTPTFDIDGTIIVEFNERRLKEALNLKRD
jgi:glutaredoxin